MKKVILAPYVSVAFWKEELHFGFGSLRKIIIDKKLQECLLDAAVFLKEAHFLHEVEDFLKDNGHHKKEIDQSQDILSENFLIPEDAYIKSDRHSRSLLFYSLSGAEIQEVQKRLSGKKVAIIGCGGIGNIAGVLLATAGIGELLLVDSDSIELSNLSRQFMFEESDCGKDKVATLAQSLKKRNSSIKINEVNDVINRENIDVLKGYDFVLVSGDQYDVLNLINDFAVQHNIPFTGVGYIEDIAVWGPLVIPGKSGCYQCGEYLLNFNKNLDKCLINKCKKINNGYQAPSNGPINMLAASLAVLDILKFLGEFGEIQSLNARIGIWTHDLHIERQDHSLNKNCLVCGKIQKAL